MLGNRETTGAPDPWWIVDENLCFIFEDHSSSESGSSLNVTKARQAATHPNWVRENLSLAESSQILSVLVTPVQKADTDALPHLKEVYLWNIDDFRGWARNSLSVIRELRKTFTVSGDLHWRATAVEKYKNAKIDPLVLVEILKSQPAADLLKP